MFRALTTKRLLAAALAAAVLAPTAAVATYAHVFDDVDEGKYFAEPVAWAAEHGITTGTTATTFEPYRGVTRGESVTFLHRYDDYIVQPALSELEGAVDDTYDKDEVDAAIAAATAPIGGVHTTPFSVEMDAPGGVDLLELDDVIVRAECGTISPGRIEVTVYVYSNADGWWAPGLSSGPISSAFGAWIWVIDDSTTETTGAKDKPLIALTPNGGYIHLSSVAYIVHSSAHDADCVVQGLIDWVPAT